MTYVTEITPELQQVVARFEAQYAASRADQEVPYAVRVDRIDRAIAMMVEHCDRLCEAMSADFGTRATALSLAVDITATIDSLKAARRRLRRWMRPERRRANFPMNLLGVSAHVHYRPLGVVCIIGAWNFPVGTVTLPMAGALAAGNRVILKPSEMTPRTAAALAEAVGAFFSPEEMTVVTGDAAVGRQLTSLPFDRIVFTGGAGTARHIMRAAAEHLVPVTLELGGKSPVIVGASADVAQATRQIMFGKLLNAGQACVGPDYLLVPKSMRDTIIRELTLSVAGMFPRIQGNADYTTVATQAHYGHLQALLEDAVSKGAKDIVINPAGEPLECTERGKMLPRLLVDVDPGMAVMQHEIFGPILPILTYEHIGEAIAFINTRPRPLALYYFGRDRREERQVLSQTVSGGVTVNDVMLHVGQENLPFGGVGASGFGQYRGVDGFREFSTAQAVVRQSRMNAVWGLLRPPYTPFKVRALRSQVKQ